MLESFILVNIHDIGDLLKSKKGNRQRQENRWVMKIAASDKINSAYKKICVLEIAKQAKVDADTKNEYQFFLQSVVNRAKHNTQGVIKQY